MAQDESDWASAAAAKEGQTLKCDEIDGIRETVGKAPDLAVNAAYAGFVASVKEHATAPSGPTDPWRMELPSDAKTSEGKAQTESVRKLCAGWAGVRVPTLQKSLSLAGDCAIDFQHDEKVAVLSHITTCGGDNCTVDRYIWRADWAKPVRLEGAQSDAVEVGPKLENVFYHRAINAIEMHTHRSTIDGSATCVVSTECFSPSLAPDGSFLLCRNRESDLLRVSTAGGDAQLVDAAELPEERRTRIRLQWGVYPTPARFLGERRVEYDIFSEPKEGGAQDTATKTVEVTLQP